MAAFSDIETVQLYPAVQLYELTKTSSLHVGRCAAKDRKIPKLLSRRGSSLFAPTALAVLAPHLAAMYYDAGESTRFLAPMPR